MFSKIKSLLNHTADDERLKAYLATVTNPDTGRDWVSDKAVKRATLKAGHAQVVLSLGYPARSRLEVLRTAVHDALMRCEGVTSAEVEMSCDIVSHVVQRGIALLPNIKNIIAVASGKGGVGKSTTTVNLALALAAEGARVGILDADIYGPSQPMMTGLSGQKPPMLPEGQGMQPLEHYGLQVMSMGFLVSDDQAMVWRGPMASQALLQLLRDTAWQQLDYLLIDMPPGTGDVQLTLAQKIPVTGAVVVTTPQDIALLDAHKGIRMFEKVGVPVLGVIENMAMHICSQCGHTEAIFGSGGGERMAQQHQVELLGQLPLDLSIRLQVDQGYPSVVAEPEGKIATIYGEIARKIAIKIAERSKDYSSRLPKVVVQS